MGELKHIPRTDLALENAKSGDELHEYTLCGIKVSEQNVRGKGRKCGRYVTLRCPIIRYLDVEESENITEAVCAVLRDFCEKLTGKRVDSETKVLVAGLGNRFITSDALGPRTADKIAVTGHMMGENGVLSALGCSSISAVHPGVMGQTGIEAAAMIKGAAEYVKPDVIIAVDALAARAVSRLAATVQITDTGIEPGSGIGNRRGAVNRETMGFPVISVGVPTIVDSATLVYDALSEAGLSDGWEQLEEVLSHGKFFVSMRDSDIVTDEVSTLLANAVNRAFFAEGL